MATLHPASCGSTWVGCRVGGCAVSGRSRHEWMPLWLWGPMGAEALGDGAAVGPNRHPTDCLVGPEAPAGQLPQGFPACLGSFPGYASSNLITWKAQAMPAATSAWNGTCRCRGADAVPE